jgi:hypothetical protein
MDFFILIHPKKNGKRFEDYLWGLLMCYHEHKKFVYEA